MNCEACTDELNEDIKYLVAVTAMGKKFNPINSRTWLLCDNCSEDMVVAIQTYLKKKRAKLNAKN